MLILPGLALAYAMNSGIVLAGTDRFTTMMLGWRMMPATGAMSHKIEVELIKESCVDCCRWVENEERVTVRCSTHDSLGADIGAPARPVLDDELQAEPLRQPLANSTRRDVGRTTSRERHN